MAEDRDDAVECRLLALVERRLHVHATLDTPLTGLGVDSLRLADFVTDLEREFDIDADQDLFDVETLGELATYVREHGRR